MAFTWGDKILNCECNHEPVATLIYLLQKQIIIMNLIATLIYLLQKQIIIMNLQLLSSTSYNNKYKFIKLKNIFLHSDSIPTMNI